MISLRRPAEAVEEEEKKHSDKGVEECGAEEVQVEPGFGLREQNASGHSD